MSQDTRSLRSAISATTLAAVLLLGLPATAEERPTAAPAPAAAAPAAHFGAADRRSSTAQEKLPTLEDNEREHIKRALHAAGGRISGPRGAAALLDVPRSTLQHRMRKLGLSG